MKAVATDRFGGPEVLSLREVDEPPLGPDSVLVAPRAAGVNPVDVGIVGGHLAGAFPTHFPLIPGWDVAGTVVAAGPGVTEFAEGDAVLAYVRRDDVQWGTLAERVSAPVRCVARLPEGADVEAAGALPLAGLTALQALDAVDAATGQTVLVHAAAGGVGSFAVQLAVLRGLRVIGTASERNHDYLRSLGAEPVAYGDGLADRVRELAQGPVDAVLDLVGGEALEASAGIVGHPSRIASIVDAQTVKRLGGEYVFVRPNAGQLAYLAGLLASGELTVEIAERFPLERAADALTTLAERHTRGKLLVTF